MEIRKWYGQHPQHNRLTFGTSVKLGKRTITSYTAAPLTRPQLSQLKRNVRDLVGYGLFPHEHKMFKCKGCANCK